jgi:hypothetical protein
MANKITYGTKVGLVAKATHVNQWWDDDANEIKTKHNANDDRITVLEDEGLLWVNIEDIADLSTISSPVGTDELVIERAGVKTKIPLSQVGSSGGAHSSLTEKDFASAGHTGFEAALTISTGLDRTGNTITSKDSEINHNALSNYDVNKHFLQSSIQITVSQISNIATIQGTFTITLPSAGSVASRIAGATEVPAGWTLTADGLNIDIEHNLGRYCNGVTVWATTTAPANQMLKGTAAENGITNVDTNNTKILSLATILKEIYIFISFAQ